ncbi:transposase [Streptomyces canus]|uniref:transposase n=1 Tax=Streptomyces canus TaxID=58343 RepID=UPI00131E4575
MPSRRPESSTRNRSRQPTPSAETPAATIRARKVNGSKRFIVTDTLGLLVGVTVLAASWQDRDGAKTALLGVYLRTPIWYVFADQGFAGVTLRSFFRCFPSKETVLLDIYGQTNSRLMELIETARALSCDGATNTENFSRRCSRSPKNQGR